MLAAGSRQQAAQVVAAAAAIATAAAAARRRSSSKSKAGASWSRQNKHWLHGKLHSAGAWFGNGIRTITSFEKWYRYIEPPQLRRALPSVEHFVSCHPGVSV
jgi:hypothetical protein